MAIVSADRRSILVHGQRELLISGAVHYPRSTPAMWPRLLRESKAAGLNCIETYVFWEGHEPEEGLYNFTGRFDLGYFLDLCREEGLYAILRIGPYVCAEWNFGGLAWWLIRKEGLVTRTHNPAFMDAVSRWVRVLLDQVGDRQITQGGPIILAQMENEYANVDKRYGDAGKEYLAWITQLGRDAGLEVPLIMCEGASDDTIETLNGFSVWDRVRPLAEHRPWQPALWTENWPGWYDVWAQPHHTRRAEEIAYEVARFFAVGGSGVNYYMWHGGTNFDRDAMYLQTTSYDFTAPLDEYGLPSAKAQHLGALHACLHAHRDMLLTGERGAAEILTPGAKGDETDSVVRYPLTLGAARTDFLVNATFDPQAVTLDGTAVTLAPRGVVVLDDGAVVYESWALPATPIVREMLPADVPLAWSTLADPLPGTGSDATREFLPALLPHNMLLDTLDMTDFGWYRTVVESPVARTARLTTRAADFLAAWVNGQYAGVTPETLQEDRPRREDFDVALDLPLQVGRNEVLLLVTALGMIKGDWMIDAPQVEEQKGLLAPVCLDGVEHAGPWEFSAGTWGEHVMLFDPDVATLAPWGPLPADGPLRWYRATFTLTREQLDDPRPWALEIGGLFKGTLWLNDFGIGRYWQQPSPAREAIPDNPWQVAHVLLEGDGRPPQHYYHLPAEWLHPGPNTLIILEERGAEPGGAGLVRRG